MNEGFASGFCGAIEMSAELSKDILSDAFVMVIDPVFKDSQNNDA